MKINYTENTKKLPSYNGSFFGYKLFQRSDLSRTLPTKMQAKLYTILKHMGF